MQISRDGVAECRRRENAGDERFHARARRLEDIGLAPVEALEDAMLPVEIKDTIYSILEKQRIAYEDREKVRAAQRRVGIVSSLWSNFVPFPLYSDLHRVETSNCYS